MPYATAQEYYLAIDNIEAQEKLLELTIADYPRMKDSGRKQIHKQMHKMAYSYLPKKDLTSADLAKKLGIDKWQTK